MKPRALSLFLVCLTITLATLLAWQKIRPATGHTQTTAAPTTTAVQASETNSVFPASVDFRTLFQRPGVPTPGADPAGAWTPTQMVVVSRPALFNDNLAVRRSVVDALVRLSRQIDVGVLYPKSNVSELAQLLYFTETQPEFRDTKQRVRPIASGVTSVKGPEFAPLFALSPERDLIAIDPVFAVSPLYMAGDDIDAFDAVARHQISLAQLNDFTGMYLTSYLRRTFNQEALLTRIPLIARSNDILFLGRGRALVSETVVIANGGDRDAILQYFADYFGVEEVLFIDPLPGETPLAIDSIA